MEKKSNFRRGSVELMILHLLSQRDFYGYELTQSMKKLSKGYLNIPVGSLYPSLYKLIEEGFISDYKKQAGRRLIRVYYHIEDIGLERLKLLVDDYFATHKAVKHVLDYKYHEGEESIIDDEQPEE